MDCFCFSLRTHVGILNANSLLCFVLDFIGSFLDAHLPKPISILEFDMHLEVERCVIYLLIQRLVIRGVWAGVHVEFTQYIM